MKQLIVLTLALSYVFTYTSISQPVGSLQNRTSENNMRFAIPDDIKTQIDNFFESLTKKEYKTGLERFLSNSPITKKDSDFSQILKELGKSIEHYGEIKGYEIVDFKMAATSYCRIKICGLHLRFPTR